MIVKIQLSINPPGRVLIYNQNNSIFWQGPMPKNIKKEMAGRLKMYWHAHVDKNKKVVLDEPAPDQDW